MLAIEEVNQLCLENLPAVTILTGDDVGQFELLKSQFLQQICYEAADLRYTHFDMKEAAYPDVEIDLVSLNPYSKLQEWLNF